MSESLTNSYKALTSEEITNMNRRRSGDEKDTNISEENLKVLRDMATGNDMDIITRPVNPVAFNQMQQGAVGKNMFVHGKSVDRGPANGFISTNASISKSGIGDDIDKIKKFQAENDHSMEHSNSEFARLENQLKAASKRLLTNGKANISKKDILKEAKVVMEEFDPLISTVNLVDKNNNQIFIFTKDGVAARPENDKDNHLYAIKLENGSFQRIDDNHNPLGEPFIPPADRKIEPVQLIGKPDIDIEKDGTIKISKVRPITADIDVLAYGTYMDLNQGSIENHKTILEEEKTQIIKESGIKLADNIKESLIHGTVEKYLNGTDLDSYKQNNPEMGKLLDDLKKSEISRENLKGMGEGIRPILDITGAMRADFANVEISHGSEQFNYGFTQPLDKEWVHIQPDGKVDVIKEEQELLKTFNNIKEKGRNIPPNPNWGWKINDQGKYEIDPMLKEQNKKVDQLMMKKSSKGTEQDKKIQEILDARLDLGLAASRKDPKLSDIEQSNKIEKLAASLNTRLKEYDVKYNSQKQDIAANINKDKAVAKIYDKLYPDDLKIINAKLNSLSPAAQKKAQDIITALSRSEKTSTKSYTSPVQNIVKQRNNGKAVHGR